MESDGNSRRPEETADASEKNRNEKTSKHDKQERNEKNKSKKPPVVPWVWVIKVFIISISISIILGIISQEMSSLNLFFALFMLVAVMALGIVFDFVGLAVATADEKPFHSMAARKIPSAKKAVWLIKNAQKVSSFCNDVVGDIVGILSGAIGAVIAVKLFADPQSKTAANILLTALISALTVGGKAVFKGIGMRYNIAIVGFVAKFLCLFEKKAHKKKK